MGRFHVHHDFVWACRAIEIDIVQSCQCEVFEGLQAHGVRHLHARLTSWQHSKGLRLRLGLHLLHNLLLDDYL